MKHKENKTDTSKIIEAKKYGECFSKEILRLNKNKKIFKFSKSEFKNVLKNSFSVGYLYSLRKKTKEKTTKNESK